MAPRKLSSFHKHCSLLKSGIFAAFFYLLALDTWASNKQFSVFSDQFIYSGALSVKEILNSSQQGIYQTGDISIAWQQKGFSTRLDNWFFIISEEQQAAYRYSSETMDFLYRVNHRLNLPEQQNIPLLMEVKQYALQKVSFARQFKPLARLSFQPQISLVKINSIFEGKLQGNVQTSNNNDYDFQFDSDYVYRKDRLFGSDSHFKPVYGYSMDIAINWKPSAQWNLFIQSKNLISQINWQQLDHSIVNARSSGKTLDEYGYLKYNPNISWLKEKPDNYQQQLIAKNTFRINYQDRENLTYQLETIQFNRFLQQRFTVQFNKAIQIGWEATTNSLLLAYYGKFLTLSFIGDNTELTKARTLGASINLFVHF